MLDKSANPLCLPLIREWIHPGPSADGPPLRWRGYLTPSLIREGRGGFGSVFIMLVCGGKVKGMKKHLLKRVV